MLLAKPIVSAMLILASAGPLYAGDIEPFIYIATQDPFIGSQTAAPRNDIHIFGGAFSEGSFGDAFQFWDADYTNNYLLGAAVGRISETLERVSYLAVSQAQPFGSATTTIPPGRYGPVCEFVIMG